MEKLRRGMRKLFLGKVQPTAADLAYLRASTRLGFSLLLFLFLFDFSGIFFHPAENWAEATLSEDMAFVVIDLIDTLGYVLSFMVSGIAFYLITPRRERVPMLLSPRVPRGTVWLVMIGICVTMMAVLFNSSLMDLFGYNGSFGDVIRDDPTVKGFEGVLLFISTAIAPAFAEEFLFRGVVCNQLRPYGKTVAVLGSALLFGLMHQNVGQLLYATVAGVVLGILYVETRSIWPSVLMHLFNNLLSVTSDILYERLMPAAANRIILIIDAIVMTLGVLSVIVMIMRAERARGRGEAPVGLLGGRWQEERAPGCEVTPALRVRYFLSLPMVAFVVLAVWQTLWLLSFVIRYA